MNKADREIIFNRAATYMARAEEFGTAPQLREQELRRAAVLIDLITELGLYTKFMQYHSNQQQAA